MEQSKNSLTLAAILYDYDNPDGQDHNFYRALVSAHKAQHIVDLGCGTGILTVTLTGAGRNVLGIDPNPAMLEQAHIRPGGSEVTWVKGTSEKIATASTDFVLMTGNVAMHILEDNWQQTLYDIARGLKPGGLLAFETRNPAAKAWRNWNKAATERTTPVGRVKETERTLAPNTQGIVIMHTLTEFLEHNEVLETNQMLQFRSYQQVKNDLNKAGLDTIACYQDWNETPFTDTKQEALMVFIAQKR